MPREEFPPTTASVPRARAFVRTTLAPHAYPDLVVQDACLAVSEFATNAILHTSGHYTVRVHHGKSRVRVEVSDTGTSDSTPHVKRPSPVAEHSRGLALIRDLATSCGVHPHPDGQTTVWAEFAAQPPSVPARPTANAALPHPSI